MALKNFFLKMTVCINWFIKTIDDNLGSLLQVWTIYDNIWLSIHWYQLLPGNVCSRFQKVIYKDHDEW